MQQIWATTFFFITSSWLNCEAGRRFGIGRRLFQAGEESSKKEAIVFMKEPRRELKEL